MKELFHDFSKFPPAKPREDIIDASGTGGVFKIFHRGAHHDWHMKIHLADFSDERQPVHPRHAIVSDDRGEFLVT